MTQSLESLNFTYLKGRIRPYKCNICKRTLKLSGSVLVRHFKSHLRGGEVMVNKWSTQEVDTLINGLLRQQSAEEIIRSLPNRTPGAVLMKLSGINQAVKAGSSNERDFYFRKYPFNDYLKEFVNRVRKESTAGFDISITGTILEKLKREYSPGNDNAIIPQKENKIDDLLRTIDETFDSLKDSFADLVDEAITQKLGSVLEEKDKKIKEQNIEIAALTSVVEATKQSSLVARLRTKLSRGA